MIINITLGAVIKEHRQWKGLKVKDLAKIVDVNPVYITQIERHNKLPSRKVMEKIAKAINYIELLGLWVKEKHPEIQEINELIRKYKDSQKKYSDRVSKKNK